MGDLPGPRDSGRGRGKNEEFGEGEKIAIQGQTRAEASPSSVSAVASYSNRARAFFAPPPEEAAWGLPTAGEPNASSKLLHAQNETKPLSEAIKKAFAKAKDLDNKN